MLLYCDSARNPILHGRDAVVYPILERVLADRVLQVFPTQADSHACSKPLTASIRIESIRHLQTAFTLWPQQCLHASLKCEARPRAAEFPSFNDSALQAG